MKTKTLLSIVCVCASIGMCAQQSSWTTSTNLLYTNPNATTKVGIGITSPTELLHINGGALKIGNSSVAADRTKNLLKFGDGNYVQIGEWELDDMLSFKANRYNFTNGNVGIGTTPSYKLDVNGNVRASQLILTGGVIDLNPSDKFTYSGRTLGHYSINWALDSWDAGGSTLWQSAWGGIKFFTKGAPRMSINGAGNVGIGTMTPAYPLQVKGKVFLETEEVISGWQYSYLHWNAHSLVLGTPAGHYAHNSVDLKPGGVSQEPLHSEFRMYTATNVGQHTLNIQLHSQGNSFFNSPGNVGIGTSTPGTKLDVVGVIRAHEVRVCLNQGCDFVFEPDYKLMSIKELSNFINTNRHLPEVAPAVEMEANGIDLSEMNAMLLKKVEELTLYIVDLNERIEALENRNK